MDHLHRRSALSRKGFLTLGASGVATAAVSALGPAAAFAAPTPPAPQGDDLGFLAFGAVAEGEEALSAQRQAPMQMVHDTYAYPTVCPVVKR